MAKSITVNVRITSQGDGLTHTDTFTYTNANGPPALYTTMSPGDNIFSAGSFSPSPTIFILVPPSSTSGQPSVSGVSKTLKGAGGDTGIPLNPAGIQILTAPALTLNYGSAEAAWLVLA